MWIGEFNEYVRVAFDKPLVCPCIKVLAQMKDLWLGGLSVQEPTAPLAHVECALLSIWPQTTGSLAAGSTACFQQTDYSIAYGLAAMEVPVVSVHLHTCGSPCVSWRPSCGPLGAGYSCPGPPR